MDPSYKRSGIIQIPAELSNYANLPNVRPLIVVAKREVASKMRENGRVIVAVALFEALYSRDISAELI